MNLSKLEEDFIGDLSQDSHELWELYEFVRHHHANAPENEVLIRGRELLASWVGRGWLKASKSRCDASVLAGDQLLAEVDKLGQAAADPETGTILLDLTDRAAIDVKGLA
ncbi:MAG: hypothetical protein EPN97_18765 [Alphaproteobacteria bacterium]|nr:MAG: hypothetical protein EPN97_18765 [Alphaproteobacteria bacterium]